MTKVLGSLSLMGFLFGLCFSLEFVFVSEQTRQERVTGFEKTQLLWMATLLTPILVLGSWLMSRVPPEGLVSNRNGYPWEAYLAFPLLSFVVMACVSTLLYMSYETIVDLVANKMTAAFDHATALASCIAYAFAASKFVGVMEKRAARERGRRRILAKQRNAEAAERKKQEMQKMGATIHETDDDEFDHGRANERHEL